MGFKNFAKFHFLSIIVTIIILIWFFAAWQVLVNVRNFLMETVMDHIIREVQEVTLTKVFKWICSTLMIFGGVVPFIPQYKEIKKKGDAEGFSLYVCLVLIFANTLRILFW